MYHSICATVILTHELAVSRIHDIVTICM